MNIIYSRKLFKQPLTIISANNRCAFLPLFAKPTQSYTFIAKPFQDQTFLELGLAQSVLAIVHGNKS